MKELLEVITKSLVEYPEQIAITEVWRDNVLVLELRVAQSDMGKVIGKQGKIAKAVRSVMKSAAIKENMRVLVDILN